MRYAVILQLKVLSQREYFTKNLYISTKKKLIFVPCLNFDSEKDYFSNTKRGKTILPYINDTQMIGLYSLFLGI